MSDHAEGRKALRAEARAWRAVAEKIDAIPRHLGTFICWHVDEPLVSRVDRHLYLGETVMLEYMEDEVANTDDRVLACLFLALECESEARR